MIREAAEAYGGFQYRNVIPLIGPLCIITHWYMQPNGSPQLELLDYNGQTFWRGNFELAND